jgi:3-methyladenine DNA glycosylase/8-oxoguanine DNA glycosylase
VLAASSKIGGFTANGGVTTKLRILAIEGARVDGADGRDGDQPARARPPRVPAGARRKDAPDGALGFDPRVAIEYLRACDKALGRLIDAVGPFDIQLQKTPSLFGALAEAIVYQQLTGKAAATIFGRVCALFPEACDGPTAESVLRVPDEQLRGAGLSRAKVLSLKDLARRAKDGEIPSLAEVRAMEDEAIIERLIEVRGIGRWTAEMLLIFRLGRPDVLPVDDYGVRKGFAAAFRKRELPARRDLEKYGARWKPYRTVASWYLWRAAERAKK